MAIDPKKLSGANLRQMALGFAIDDLECEPESVDGVSPEEAKRRSITAYQALKDRLKAEALAENQAEDKQPSMKNFLGWGDDFYRLLDHGWPWRIAAYIAWASSPRIGRYPRTQEELATEILRLTSDRRISTWRSKYPEIDETIGLMQAAPLMDSRRDAFEALAKSASDPSHHGAQDRKTFFTMTTDYVPHQKVDVEREVVDPLDLPTSELRKIASQGEKESQ